MDDEQQSGGQAILTSEFDLMPLVDLDNLADVVSGTLQGEYIGAFDWNYYVETTENNNVDFVSFGSNLWEYLATLVPPGEQWIMLGGLESSVYIIYGDDIEYDPDTMHIGGVGRVIFIEHSWGDVSGNNRRDFTPVIWKLDYGEIPIDLDPSLQYTDTSQSGNVAVYPVPFGSFEGMIHLDTAEYAQTYMIGLVVMVVACMYIIGRLFRWVLRIRSDVTY